MWIALSLGVLFIVPGDPVLGEIAPSILLRLVRSTYSTVPIPLPIVSDTIIFRDGVVVQRSEDTLKGGVTFGHGQIQSEALEDLLLTLEQEKIAEVTGGCSVDPGQFFSPNSSFVEEIRWFGTNGETNAFEVKSPFTSKLCPTDTETVFETIDSILRDPEATRGHPTVGTGDGAIVPPVPDATALPLLGGRFLVTVYRLGSDGFAEGIGNPVSLASSDTGLFWFFSPENWEVLVKVLDGCASGGTFWVFGVAATDVGFTVHVRDTLTGEEWTHTSPPGALAPAFGDTAAFACP